MLCLVLVVAVMVPYSPIFIYLLLFFFDIFAVVSHIREMKSMNDACIFNIHAYTGHSNEREEDNKQMTMIRIRRIHSVYFFCEIIEYKRQQVSAQCR